VNCVEKRREKERRKKRRKRFEHVHKIHSTSLSSSLFLPLSSFLSFFSLSSDALPRALSRECCSLGLSVSSCNDTMAGSTPPPPLLCPSLFASSRPPAAMSLAWQPLPALEWLEANGGPLCAAAAPRLRALLLAEVSAISCFPSSPPLSPSLPQIVAKCAHLCT